MRIASVLAAAAIAVSCGPGIGQAQSLSKAVPAEFPPSSYSGRQYVDSRGCVFIRAGVDGAVTWVPRVTRGRKHICGFQPSLSASARATVTAQRTAAPATQTATATTAATPKVVRRTTATTATATTTKRVATVPAYRRAPVPPAPVKPEAPVTVAKVATTTTTTQPRRVSVATCTGASAVSQQYLSSRKYSVRCGPQAAPHVTERATASANATVYRHSIAPVATTATYQRGTQTYTTQTYVTGAVRIAPKHVYASQKTATEGVFVPEGYAPVWDDDRLNPRRAHQTYAGKAQMDALWTRTTPRRLKKRKVTDAVIKDYSGVTAPAYSFRQTAPAAATVTRTATAAKVAPAPVPETKAKADTKASHRYVQLGAFTDPANARNVAQRLANSGLPARMGDVTRKGKSYTLVLAGPFSTQAQLDSGLQRVRGMGYVQAVLRK